MSGACGPGGRTEQAASRGDRLRRPRGAGSCGPEMPTLLATSWMPTSGVPERGRGSNALALGLKGVGSSAELEWGTGVERSQRQFAPLRLASLRALSLGSATSKSNSSQVHLPSEGQAGARAASGHSEKRPEVAAQCSCWGGGAPGGGPSAKQVPSHDEGKGETSSGRWALGNQPCLWGWGWGVSVEIERLESKAESC